MDNIFGVNIVAGSDKQDEKLVVSSPKITHIKNMTTGEVSKILGWVDAIKVENIATQPSNKAEDK